MDRNSELDIISVRSSLTIRANAITISIATTDKVNTVDREDRNTPRSRRARPTAYFAVRDHFPSLDSQETEQYKIIQKCF